METLLQVDFGRGLKYMYTFILENTAHKLFFFLNLHKFLTGHIMNIFTTCLLSLRRIYF